MNPLEKNQQNLSRLKEKIIALKKQYEVLKELNMNMEKEIGALKGENEELKTLVDDFQKRNKMSKIAVTMKPEDKVALKNEIKGYIREIDTCINLLANVKQE